MNHKQTSTTKAAEEAQQAGFTIAKNLIETGEDELSEQSLRLLASRMGLWDEESFIGGYRFGQEWTGKSTQEEKDQ